MNRLVLRRFFFALMLLSAALWTAHPALGHDHQQSAKTCPICALASTASEPPDPTALTTPLLQGQWECLLESIERLAAESFDFSCTPRGPPCIA